MKKVKSATLNNHKKHH